MVEIAYKNTIKCGPALDKKQFSVYKCCVKSDDGELHAA